MPPKKDDAPVLPEHRRFLNTLRRKGIVNMYESSPFLERHFHLTRNEATAIVARWMRSFTKEDE